MRLSFRAALAAALVSLVVLAGASSAFACGNGGYTYAGVAAPDRAYGIRAAITPLSSFNILDGHVAGWVGVGGPKQGPGGSDEWLQVGFSGFAAPAGNNLYYELMLPNGNPVYHQIATGLPAGKAANVAVLEMSGRPDVWRVWVNGSPASKPIRLPGSHGRFAPIATAESWDGGSGGACNGFLYRFRGVSIASSPGGGWQPLAGGTTIKSASTRLAASSRLASFLAAEGDDALRTLALLSP